MKKTVKRILCGAMALTMVSSIVLERVLHIHSDGVASANSLLATEASFTNVTGQFDTSKMVQENFNDTVKKTEDTTVQHKTRTVMVTLSAKPLIERANGEPVGEYMQSWDGNRAVAEIGAEQTAFLKALSQAGIRYELVRTYNTVLNGVAIIVNTQHLDTIRAMSKVCSAFATGAYSVPETVETVSAGGGVIANETSVYNTGIYDSSAYAEQYGEEPKGFRGLCMAL